ncbi:MAG: RNA polymerase factor sigma-54, partial [Planctomycetota bacterium]
MAIKLSMVGQMRMEQKMKLAPRMIQSMEVLQLPLLALQEKIEAELNSNPVLEVVEEPPEQVASTEDDIADIPNEQELVVGEDSDNVDDFQRLESLGDDYAPSLNGDETYSYQPQIQRSTGDPDK